jgi:hypothetical protein
MQFRILLPIILVLQLISSCAEKSAPETKVYSYLEVCFEDYYLNHGVQISDHLNSFEKHLLSEGHLKDTTGEAYLDLIRKLSKTIYFDPPLEYDDFNNAVLYKVPEDITDCARSIFGIDSSLIRNTGYFKAQEKIRIELQKNEEISINDVFRYNSKYLSPKTVKAPFVKQSILQLLYKWYFKSKFDREIPKSEEQLIKNNDSTQVRVNS